MEKIDTDKKTLKKFGITMCIAFLVITVLIIIRHGRTIVPTTAISLVFLILTLIQPLLLKPAYIIWMKLAFVLGWINTRIILIAIFYLVFAPFGLVMRAFGADLLERKIEKNKTSYWKPKEKKEFNLGNYERQF